MRVHGNDGARLAFERLLGGHLHVEIDGQADVLAGRSHLLPAHADLFTVGVDDHVAGAVDAAQHLIVGLLNAGLADHVAGRVEGKLGLIEVVL